MIYYIVTKKKRDQLVLENLKIAEIIARKFCAKIPHSVPLEEVISDATLGLIDAAERFDKSKNVKFQTYAEHRIRGAILDGLRERDWIGRTTRDRIKEISKTIKELEGKLKGTPTHAQIAKALNLKIEEYYQLINEAREPLFIYLDDPLQLSCIDNKVAEEMSKEYNEKEKTKTLKKGKDKAIEKALGELKGYCGLVLFLYYYEHLTNREIAECLGLTEGRISQIHKEAINKLKGNNELARLH